MTDQQLQSVHQHREREEAGCRNGNRRLKAGNGKAMWPAPHGKCCCRSGNRKRETPRSIRPARMTIEYRGGYHLLLLLGVIVAHPRQWLLLRIILLLLLLR